MELNTSLDKPNDLDRQCWRISLNRTTLEDLYRRLNRREFIHPDPLEIVLRFRHVSDREIAALIASALAYGRVTQILTTVSSVINVMGRPYRYMMTADVRRFRADFGRFKHRFTTSDELVTLLMGIKSAVAEYGSLERSLSIAHEKSKPDCTDALTEFVNRLKRGSEVRNSLLPDPVLGSACKRLNLFLKWMVREDEVDPGGWRDVDPSMLIVPLDTHMYRIGRALGASDRKSADLKAAREITSAFRNVAPDDPTRYDFALTRLGMRFGASVVDMIERA